MNKCLYCYLPCDGDFHGPCSRKIFGNRNPPVLSYSENDIETLGLQIIQTHTALTGVQPKLSLHSETQDGLASLKFTFIGLIGDYILKPPSVHYSYLPENEDLTLHLAKMAKIRVVPHTLVRLESGSLAYLTRRIDRKGKQKFMMEDFCQLTEKMTEQKYQGSYERIAKAVMKYSDYPLLDVVNFWEVVLFSFLTGNSDMHLKNFSLLHLPNKGYHLAPAYDMLAVELVNPSDSEELALTLNAKKRKITRSDFVRAFELSGLTLSQQTNIFKKMEQALPKWLGFIEISFLPVELQKAYRTMLFKKFAQLGYFV